MERKHEESLRGKLRDARLSTPLTLITEAVQAIWASDAPRIVQGFTDHGVEHSNRVAGWAGLLLAKAEDPGYRTLSPDELFLLLAGAYLHDIGMQADVKSHPGIREAAEALGAHFDSSFDISSPNNYSPEEQGAIRKNHQYLTAARIQLAKRPPGGGTGTKLERAIGRVDDSLIQDLMDVCKYHSTLEIATCPLFGKNDHGIRLQMVAALLRLSDELDVNSRRVDIDTVKNFGMSPENALYWYLHKWTHINLIGTGIRITVGLHPEDMPLVGAAVQECYIDKFAGKNEPLLEILQAYQIPIIIDNLSKVQEDPIAERLPKEIIDALQNMAHSWDKLPNDVVREFVNDFTPPLGSQHFGRQDLLETLQKEMQAHSGSVVCVHAAAGEGKSTLFWQLHATLAAEPNPYAGAKVVLHWRFSSPASNAVVGQTVSDFLEKAITILGAQPPTGESDDFARASLLLDLVNRHKPLLILEGIDALLEPTAPHSIANQVMRHFIRTIASRGLRQGGLVLLGSTQPISDLEYFAHGRNISLPSLTDDDCVNILRSFGASGNHAKLQEIARRHDHYPLAIALLGKEMARAQLSAADVLRGADALPESKRMDAVYAYYDAAYPEDSGERTALYALSLFRRDASWPEIQRVLMAAAESPDLKRIRPPEWDGICSSLEDRGFIVRNERSPWMFALSPRVLREHTADVFFSRHPVAFRSCNQTLASMCGEKYVPVHQPALPALEPLYDEAFYLCRAGAYARALDIYWEKLCRQREFYTQKILGAFSKDLQLVSLFFRRDSWEPRDDLDLNNSERAWLFAVAAYLLNALGALPEADELRERETRLHEEMGNYSLAAQDLMLLATTQMFQCKTRPALENLAHAQELLIIGAAGEAGRPNRYSGAIDVANLRNHIQARSALVEYFVSPFEVAWKKADELDLSALDTSSAFFAFLVLLDGLGKDAGYSASPEDFKKWATLINAYQGRALAAGRSCQEAYGEALQALVAWRAKEGRTEVLKHLEVALKAMTLSGRLDVAPMIYLLSLQLAIAFEESGTTLVPSAKRDTWHEELKASLTIHHADLYQIQYSILRIRLLKLSGVEL